jgi:molybdopterin converting factor subunit 1
MRVSLQLFASLRELVGAKCVEIELREGATVDDLKARLALDYPVLQPIIATVACAVDDDYVAASQELHEGAEVALIPPVSGGAQTVDAPPTSEPFWLTRERLEPHAQTLVRLVGGDRNGAVTLFYGIVRNENDGRQVLRLEYDAHESMALKKMRETAQDTKGRFPEISEVGAWHRIGMLEVGETSLLVAVSSPHRKEAFEACHWAVDRIKQVVPVWKKEFFEGGAVWVEGHPVETPRN